MHHRSLWATFGAAVVLGVMCTTAKADLPPNWTVWFNIREEPTNPKSDIIFVVELNLEAVDSFGDWVGWRIRRAEFRKPGAEGDVIWVADSPDPRTPDGLWWIKHADPYRPLLDEFLLPPLLEGVAVAKDLENSDLEYMVEGVPYDPLRMRAPFRPTAALDYEFAVMRQKSPPEQGEDEPVEPGGEEDPT